MTGIDEKMMALALDLARQAEAHDEIPIGAVLVQGDRILAQGCNRREETHRTCGHAEIEALEKYNAAERSWRLPPHTTLYVTLEPCLMCTGALLWARLDHIVFGCADTKNAGLLKIQPWIEQGVFDHRFRSVRSGVQGEACGEILSDYFRKKRESQKLQRQPE